METLFDCDQLATRLGLQRKTVERWCRSGKIDASKVGREYRVSEKNLIEFIEAGRRLPNSAAPMTAEASAKSAADGAARTAEPGDEKADKRPEPKRAHRKSSDSRLQTQASLDSLPPLPPPGPLSITSVVNQKGGVGKTTTTFNIGVGLLRRGRRVLLVDLDPQGALTASAGVSIGDDEATIYDALFDPEIDPDRIIRKTPIGMHLLPATIDLAGAEIDLVSIMLREYVLKRLLSRLPDYDHILIDCPPSLGLLTVNALAASDFALIPVQCSYLSWRGLPLLSRTISKIRAVVNPSLRPLGILPTLFDGRTTHAHETLELLRLQRPGEVLPFVIKSTVRAQEAAKAGLSLIDFDPKSEAALTYLMLAEEVDRVAREQRGDFATPQILPGGQTGGQIGSASGASNVSQA